MYSVFFLFVDILYIGYRIKQQTNKRHLGKNGRIYKVKNWGSYKKLICNDSMEDFFFYNFWKVCPFD